jgi:hypothetical protein
MMLLVLGLLTSFAAAPAAAQDLDQLRASGAIGERYDGYAAVRDSGAAGASQLVRQVNNQRRGIYEQRAASQGVSAEEVGRVYAAQIMQKAPRGTWFLGENGNWRQK